MEDLCPIGIDETPDSDTFTDRQKKLQQETIEYCSNIKNSYQYDKEKSHYNPQNIYKINLDKNREAEK